MLELAGAMLGALALAFAFPKNGQAWLAPFGAAALFWAWQRLSWKRAFFTGWFAGTIFFAINYSWFTYTVGDYVGSLAFAVVLIPALVEALAWGLSAVCLSVALRVCPAWLAPAAGAAAFTVFEWLRSIGPVAVPFAQIGYSQTSTPLGVFAAYVGCFGVTFVVMLLGGYLALAVRTRRARALATCAVIVGVAWAACYAAWPARHAVAPALRVAAVQGNIPQSLKANDVQLGVDRYTAMTKRLAPLHPALIVWPETVILTNLNFSDRYWNLAALAPDQRSDIEQQQAYAATLRRQFAALAKSLNATLVVGSQDLHYGGEGLKIYNALYTFGPGGSLVNVYDKRQLVPFAESLPAPAIFGHLPSANLIGRFGHGRIDAVIPAGGMLFAPLICWESAFADLVHAQIRNGAQVLIVPTDDAWFGESSGTYQHAQIAQMRAIESGEWVVQAASTGISGIISPDGRWVEALQLDKQGVVVGNVGLPAGSFFARIGPDPVAYGCVAVYVLLLLIGIACNKRRPSR